MTEPIDPDLLEQVEFPVVRRGVDPAAVRTTLAEAADALRLLKRRGHELEHQVEALESQIPDPEQAESEREAAQAEGRSAGEAAGARLEDEARAEAERLVAEAKEEGRRLVGEAQTVRRRMLEDLARRRRALRQQIEQLRGGRERLLEAYEVVGHTMREATAELSAALPEARAAAERAGHGVGPEETVEQLEAEIESGRLAGLPIVAEQVPPADPEVTTAPRRRPVAVPLERDVRDMPEVEPLVADFEEVRVLSDEADLETDPTVGETSAAADGGSHEDEGDDEDTAPSPGEPVIDEPLTVISGSDGPGPEEGPADLDVGVADPSASGGEASRPEHPEADPPEASASSEPEPADGDDGDDAEGGGGEEDSDDDLFARLRRSRQQAEAEAVAAEEARGGEEADAAPGAEAVAPEPDPGGVESSPSEDLDHPDDAAEPFGLVLGVDNGTDPTEGPTTAERISAEHDLARSLKRLLSDEQNDVLDRLRRTRKRSLAVDDLLDDLDDRVSRFAQAVEPILADAAAVEVGADAEPVDDLAAELAREVAEALADGLVEPLEEARPVDDMAGPVRALYRNWKTDRIGALAARYVDAACEPTQSAI